jgi:hypothetical protein
LVEISICFYFVCEIFGWAIIHLNVYEIFFFSFAFPNVQNYIWLKYNRYHIDNKKIPANFLFYASIIKIMVFFLLFFFFILIFIINYTYGNKDFNMFNLWGVILTLTLHNNDTTPRHNGVEGKWFLYTKCTINVQHPFIWGGLHTLWGPPHVKGCCTFVVGVMYNYHYSEWSLCVGPTSLCFGVVSLLCSVSVLIISLNLYELN